MILGAYVAFAVFAVAWLLGLLWLIPRVFKLEETGVASAVIFVVAVVSAIILLGFMADGFNAVVKEAGHAP